MDKLGLTNRGFLNVPVWIWLLVDAAAIWLIVRRCK
jgi:hypothetical protein